jgi:protein OS-9
VEFHSEAIPENLKAHRPIPDALLSSHEQQHQQHSATVPGQGKWKRTKAPNGTEYLCYVPGLADVAEAEFARRGATASQQSRRKVGPVAPDIAALVAQELAGACTSKVDVWNAQVRQFHVGNNGAIEKEYFLGKGPLQQVEDGTKEEDLSYGEHPTYGPYLSTVFYNGTVCDLTGEPRQTEVRLYCSGAAGSHQPASNVNLRVTEPKSCQYLVQWWSPQACIPLLQKEVGVNLAIKCYDVALLN